MRHICIRTDVRNFVSQAPDVEFREFDYLLDVSDNPIYCTTYSMSVDVDFFMLGYRSTLFLLLFCVSLSVCHVITFQSQEMKYKVNVCTFKKCCAMNVDICKNNFFCNKICLHNCYITYITVIFHYNRAG